MQNWGIRILKRLQKPRMRRLWKPFLWQTAENAQNRPIFDFLVFSSGLILGAVETLEFHGEALEIQAFQAIDVWLSVLIHRYTARFDLFDRHTRLKFIPDRCIVDLPNQCVPD